MKPAWWHSITRDLVLFVAGLAFIVNEAVIRQAPPRPELLVLFAAMIGSPLVFRADQKRRKDDD